MAQNSVPALISAYEQALALAQAQAAESERVLYGLHLRELQHLRALLATGGSASEVKAAIAREKRAFGWSYLGGGAGEAAENAFHALAKQLEE